MMQRRTDRIMNILSGKKPDKVPIMLEMETSYCCEMQGVDFIDATWNYDMLIQGFEGMINTFKMDVCLGVQWLSPQKSAILGSQNWQQNRDNGIMQHPEIQAMQESEYTEFLAAPYKCISEKMLPRLYKNLNGAQHETNTALLKAFIFEQNQVNDFYNKMYEVSYRYSLPLYYGTMFYAPFDLLADHMRGITSIACDMRRKEKEVTETCEVLQQMTVEFVANSMQTPEEGFPFACSWVHLPPMISPKQFEKFFMPSFKYVCDSLVDKGYNLYLNFQGDYTDGKYYDEYSDLPSNHAVFSVEKQDFKKTAEILGKYNPVCTGFPLSYFKNHSEAECLDKAKELLDIGMKDGRFYFGINQPPLSSKDAPFETLKAVLNFVDEYGVY